MLSASALTARTAELTVLQAFRDVVCVPKVGVRLQQQIHFDYNAISTMVCLDVFVSCNDGTEPPGHEEQLVESGIIDVCAGQVIDML